MKTSYLLQKVILLYLFSGLTKRRMFEENKNCYSESEKDLMLET